MYIGWQVLTWLYMTVQCTSTRLAAAHCIAFSDCSCTGPLPVDCSNRLQKPVFIQFNSNFMVQDLIVLLVHVCTGSRFLPVETAVVCMKVSFCRRLRKAHTIGVPHSVPPWLCRMQSLLQQ
jgi:hypothetical protein